MIPPNLSQAPDDRPTSGYETDPNTLNGNEIDEDRLSPEKSPPQTNAIGEDDTGIPLFDEDSVDLSSPDTPATTRTTDSEGELTDDDDQYPVEQQFQNRQSTKQLVDGAVPESAVKNSISNHQYTIRRVDGHYVISGRRQLHANKGIHHYKESFIQHFNIAKDKIIEFIKKFHYKFFVKNKLMASIIFIITLAMVYNLVSPVNESSPKSMQYYISEEILNHYPTQDKRDLRNLIRVINNVNQGKHETDKVAVITIMYSHRETAECLAKTTANYAVKVINRSKDFVRLNGSLSNADFYLGNEDFKKNIKDKGVLVVYDFHNFPAEKVRYFHGICDKHTPYIEDKAVYIILLEMSKNQDEVSKKLEKVQSRIEELWSTLKSEILYPLGTRLMDNVMVIREEPKLLWC